LRKAGVEGDIGVVERVDLGLVCLLPRLGERFTQIVFFVLGVMRNRRSVFEASHTCAHAHEQEVDIGVVQGSEFTKRSVDDVGGNLAGGKIVGWSCHLDRWTGVMMVPASGLPASVATASCSGSGAVALARVLKIS
jgi:hypothetical protein